MTFADLGVDALVVDEAQEFKNLFITTSLSRISGLGNLTGSEKAFDLFVKCRYLQQKYDGRGVFLATGTPLSNTIAELYTVQRYMQYDELKERGIVHFDAWASTFGQVVTGWELDATGVNYRLNSRFSRFQNVPELNTMYRTFADVITRADLQQQAAERGTRFPVPRVKGGRPQTSSLNAPMNKPNTWVFNPRYWMITVSQFIVLTAVLSGAGTRVRSSTVWNTFHGIRASTTR